jgi:uncharacterized coiled-coil protein SlyX
LSDLCDYYLTTTEAAQVLNVTRRTLARYKAQGKIAPIKGKNKDLYAPEELARFSASAESDVDKLRKQNVYNSARINELEMRLAAIESMLELSKPTQQLTSSDVDTAQLRKALDALCKQRLSLWDMTTAEDTLRDLALLAPDVIRALGDVVPMILDILTLYVQSQDTPRKTRLLVQAELLRSKMVH